MRQQIYKLSRAILKNLLAFAVGGILGVATSLLFARQLLESAINKNVGLGIIALAPVLLIIYAVIFGTIGGIIGIVIYNLNKLIKSKKTKL